MKKYILGENICWVFILSAVTFCNIDVHAESNDIINPIEQPKKLDFDKKRYDELIKNILRTKTPSVVSAAAGEVSKEFLYLCASVAAGIGADMDTGKLSSDLFAAVLTHTLMQLLFDHMLAGKDQNLKNLENFEKYVHQTFDSNDDLVKKNAGLILKLFEKDYVLILNKIDQDRGPGVLRKMIRFLFKESILATEAVFFGAAAGTYSSERGTPPFSTGFVAGGAYFLMLTLIFNGLLADKDQHLLKIEKLRDIDQFFEEVKMDKIVAQHELVAASVE